MLVKKYDEIKKEKVNIEGADNTSIRWLIGKDSKAPNFYLRLFEIEPEGNGRLNSKGKSIPFKKGYFALILPDEEHQFENTGNTTLKLLCIVPK
jgi:quercetin dioxygenase-like cupin family protein